MAHIKDYIPISELPVHTQLRARFVRWVGRSLGIPVVVEYNRLGMLEAARRVHKSA